MSGASAGLDAPANLPAGSAFAEAVAFLARELRPRPGRLADALRLTMLVLVTVVIGETFRLPEIAVSAYVVLFVSRNERSSTITTATVAGTAVVLAAFACVVVFMASLSEPAVRVPAIAGVTFVAMFLSRVSPLGPALFAAGFILAYGLTIGDQVLGIALQPFGISETTDPGPPALLSIPPEEALLRFLLWLAPVVAVPVGLVVVGNLLTGRRPLLLLREGLADRLEACARFCEGEPGSAPALAATARQGSAAFEKLRLGAPAGGSPDFAALIRGSEQLALALLAWPAVAPATDPRAGLRPCAGPLRDAARSLRTGTRPPEGAAVAPATATTAARPLSVEVALGSAAVLRALREAPATGPGAAAPKPSLVSPEAVRDPATVRFALKVTLAVMLAYAAETLLDWPAIHTCVVTCFFVALGTVGESVHKATLRVAGALIGGALGIGTILLLMPLMTDLGGLMLALAAVTFLAGWVAGGSERIGYAGLQIGLAYYLAVLQGYGPTLDMQTARDRVLGILLGDAIVLVVFTAFWPVGVADAVRGHVADALGAMARLVRLERETPGAAAIARPALQEAYASAMNGARGLMEDAGYEKVTVGAVGRRHPLDAVTLAAMDAVTLALFVVLNVQADSDWDVAPAETRHAALAYHDRLADWLERCGIWVRTGACGETLEADIPHPPALAGLASEPRAAWYAVLDRELRAAMARVMRHGAVDA